MKTITYLSLDEVIAIHDDLIQRYGGSFGIRDLGLLNSALARPQATFGGEDLYPDVVSKAAALFHSLIFNHAFVDGNKRTTITATARFLYINSFELDVKNEEFVSFPLQVEKEHLSIEEIAGWLEKHVKKVK